MASPEEVAEDAAGELGGGLLPLGGFLEEAQGGLGFPMHAFGAEDDSELAGHGFDLGRAALVEKEGRLFQ